MTIHIYDGQAVLRRRFDTNFLGSGPRKVFMEALSLPRTDVAIWCFEGRGSLAERRRLFPGYKDRPSSMTTGIRALIDLTRQALAHTRALQISVPGREADDVIAHLCEVHGPTAADGITVHTVDRDLLQLSTDRVKVDAAPLVVKVEEGDRSKDVTLLPGEIRLYKTLVGDTSDKIPGMRGFGGKAFVACDRRLLQAAMNALLQGNPVPALFERAGVKTGMAERICAPEQAAQLRAFWSIVGFLPMPGDWEDGIQVGKEDTTAGDAVLRQFMH